MNTNAHESDTSVVAPVDSTPLADAYRAAHAAMVAADAHDDATPCPDECLALPGDAHMPGCVGLAAREAYHVADRACDAARAAWLASDEPRDWATGGDSWGGGMGPTIEGIAPSDIEERLSDDARDGDWTIEEGTIWVSDWAAPIDPVSAMPLEAERVRVTVQLDPEEPVCEDGHDHNWIVKRTTGHGGGVIVTEICEHCGIHMVTDTWAQDRHTGEQGLTSVRYDDSDEG